MLGYREYRVIEYLVEGKTQTEIAKEFDVSKTRISSIVIKIRNKILPTLIKHGVVSKKDLMKTKGLPKGLPFNEKETLWLRKSYKNHMVVHLWNFFKAHDDWEKADNNDKGYFKIHRDWAYTEAKDAIEKLDRGPFGYEISGNTLLANKHEMSVIKKLKVLDRLGISAKDFEKMLCELRMEYG